MGLRDSDERAKSRWTRRFSGLQGWALTRLHQRPSPRLHGVPACRVARFRSTENGRAAGHPVDQAPDFCRHPLQIEPRQHHRLLRPRARLPLVLEHKAAATAAGGRWVGWCGGGAVERWMGETYHFGDIPRDVVAEHQHLVLRRRGGFHGLIRRCGGGEVEGGNRAREGGGVGGSVGVDIQLN